MNEWITKKETKIDPVTRREGKWITKKEKKEWISKKGKGKDKRDAEKKKLMDKLTGLGHALASLAGKSLAQLRKLLLKGPQTGQIEGEETTSKYLQKKENLKKLGPETGGVIKRRGGGIAKRGFGIAK